MQASAYSQSAWIAGRLLFLAERQQSSAKLEAPDTDSDSDDANTRHFELADLLSAVDEASVRGPDLDVFALFTAVDFARKVTSGDAADAAKGSIEADAKEARPPAPATLQVPPRGGPQPGTEDTSWSLEALHEQELNKIGDVVVKLRQRAQDMRSQVHASDSMAATTAEKLGKVLQAVRDGAAAIETTNRKSQSMVERALSSVPVIGPTVLAPLASVLMHALWIICVIGVTLSSISMMLMVPRAKVVFVQA